MTKNDWEHISGPVGRIVEKAEARIAAIPTKYAGVQFRSRLEARWAAFFDLNELKWEYEPMDLKGWTPDFLIRPVVSDIAVNVYAEVKPVSEPSPTEECYRKAIKYWRDTWVLLLGAAPLDYQIGCLMYPPKADTADLEWSAVNGTLSGYDTDTWNLSDQRALWREAGNRVQWRAPEALGR